MPIAGLGRLGWPGSRRRTPPPPRKPSLADNPFAPAPSGPAFNPFLDGDDDDGEPENPFAPRVVRERPALAGVPRKYALLDRGRGVFGTYAKVGMVGDRPVAYAQFGPLSAYPRAQRVRDLYPQLPASPLPGRHHLHRDHARGSRRRTRPGAGGGRLRRPRRRVASRPSRRIPRPACDPDATSAATPGFWLGCGFVVAVDDDRFPVMRREL